MMTKVELDMMLTEYFCQLLMHCNFFHQLLFSLLMAHEKFKGGTELLMLKLCPVILFYVSVLNLSHF